MLHSAVHAANSATSRRGSSGYWPALLKRAAAAGSLAKRERIQAATILLIAGARRPRPILVLELVVIARLIRHERRAADLGIEQAAYGEGIVAQLLGAETITRHESEQAVVRVDSDGILAI